MTTADEIAAPSRRGADWRLQIPEARRRHLQIWLGSGAALTFLIVVIGGITRLTQSGLSIVDWDPVMGIVPPLGEAEWREAFERYRQLPEYQQLRKGMSLSEFQFIFLWEYVHRLVARVIGVVFLFPCLYFLARGYFGPPLRRRVLVLLGLGALQGFVGWFMVSSGLVDRPHVSHYRLALHLSIALAIFGYCVWLIRELQASPARAVAESGRGARVWAKRWIGGLGLLLALQILWGAFVAGLDAGLHSNTFPLMGGRLVPPAAFSFDPWVRNLVENPLAVQWIHRVLGTSLLLAATAFPLLARRRRVDPTSVRLGLAFLLLVLVQYGFGILTLVRSVPVTLGAIHQAVAVVILGVWLVWLHQARGPAERARSRGRSQQVRDSRAMVDDLVGRS